MLIKKIRDYINGSTVNTGNHWCRILIYTTAGAYLTNATSPSVTLAAYDGSDVAASWGASSGAPTDFIFNPSVVTTPYAYSSEPGVRYVEATLSTETDISFIRIVHYFGDGRTYYSTKVLAQNTASGTNWITLFDSAVSGTYGESDKGLYLKVSGLTPGAGIETDMSQYNDLRALISAYWSSASGGASNAGIALTSAASKAATDSITASDVSSLLADVRRMFVTPSGNNQLGQVTSYIKNGSYATLPAGPSAGTAMSNSTINNIRAMYGFLSDVNCFVCVTAKLTCTACNGSAQIPGTCVGCNTTCVTSNNPKPCNNCVACQQCYSTCKNGN